MAATKHSAFKVNLLIEKGDKTKLYFSLVKWLLSSGKFIVILVELLVVGAFVARYKLDADLADLKEEIESQVPYIKSLSEDEKKIKDTQFQLTSIRKVKDESSDYSQIINKLSQLTPQLISLSNLSLDQTKAYPKILITISGSSYSTKEVSAFIKALKKESAFTEVTLTNISFDNEVLFTITTVLTSSKGIML